MKVYNPIRIYINKKISAVYISFLLYRLCRYFSDKILFINFLIFPLKVKFLQQQILQGK